MIQRPAALASAAASALLRLQARAPLCTHCTATNSVVPFSALPLLLLLVSSRRSGLCVFEGLALADRDMRVLLVGTHRRGAVPASVTTSPVTTISAACARLMLRLTFAGSAQLLSASPDCGDKPAVDVLPLLLNALA